MRAIVKVTGKLFSTISVKMTDIIMLLFLLLISCNRNMPAFDNNLTASVSLNIPLVGESLSRVPVNGDENAVNELRVVVFSQGFDKSVNKLFTREELVNSNGKLIIEEVPVGNVQMYVIANETSLGRNYDDITDLKNDVTQVDESRKVLIIDAGRSFFPKRGSEFPSFNPKLGLKKRGLLQEKSPLDRQMTRAYQKNLPVGDFSVVYAVEQKNNNFYFILSKPSCSNEQVC